MLYLTALSTVITHITIIPLGTYNTTSWYIFFWDDATSLVHLYLVFSGNRSLLQSSILTDSSWVWSQLTLLTELLNWTVSLLPLIAGLLLFWCSLMYCTVRLYREHHVQRLHVICVLWVQRVNCCVEKGVRLVVVLSLLRNDFSVAFILVA
jgi:hypothetical protein